MRMLVAFAIAVLACVRAYADPVPVPAEPPGHAIALLPLDADADLELYGQPVAAEIARALVQGGLEVVLVGPKMAVPAKARLVIDGTIKAVPAKAAPAKAVPAAKPAKPRKPGTHGRPLADGDGDGDGGAVTLSVRIRDSRDGTVYDTLVVTAPSFTAIDRAQEQLSAKVLPAVKGRLATLISRDESKATTAAADTQRAVRPAPRFGAMLAAISTPPNATPAVAALRGALETELVPWAALRHHAVRVLDLHVLGGPAAPRTVTAAHAELAVEFVVLAVEIDHAPVPLATARVRMRISDRAAVVFDRVIVTDTVVGDKGIDTAGLAARIAREVLAIADPHLKLGIPSWW